MIERIQVLKSHVSLAKLNLNNRERLLFGWYRRRRRPTEERQESTGKGEKSEISRLSLYEYLVSA